MIRADVARHFQRPALDGAPGRGPLPTDLINLVGQFASASIHPASLNGALVPRTSRAEQAAFEAQRLRALADLAEQGQVSPQQLAAGIRASAGNLARNRDPEEEEGAGAKRARAAPRTHIQQETDTESEDSDATDSESEDEKKRTTKKKKPRMQRPKNNKQ